MAFFSSEIILNHFPMELFDSMNTDLHYVLKENMWKFSSIAPTQINV